jgi:hypothetical protein
MSPTVGNIPWMTRVRPQMEELPVVVQVERIDVGALLAERLLDPQGLATADLDGLAGTGLERCSTIDVIAVRERCANAASCDDFARPLGQDVAAGRTIAEHAPCEVFVSS